MGLKVCCLGSGSTGNCIYIASETTAVLVDQGLPLTYVEKCLRVLNAPSKPSIVVTHAHADHIGGIPAFVKRFGTTVYSGRAAYTDLCLRGVPETYLNMCDETFSVGDITVEPFAVSHDVPCCGYTFASDGGKVSVATDLGHAPKRVLDAMSDSGLVVLECNHDEELVKHNANYSYFLKRRILSDRGHLSNAACAEAAAYLACRGVRKIILAHLSQENNSPEEAESAVRDRLAVAGCCDVRLEVAPPDRMTELCEIIA